MTEYNGWRWSARREREGARDRPRRDPDLDARTRSSGFSLIEAMAGGAPVIPREMRPHRRRLKRDVAHGLDAHLAAEPDGSWVGTLAILQSEVGRRTSLWATAGSDTAAGRPCRHLLVSQPARLCPSADPSRPGAGPRTAIGGALRPLLRPPLTAAVCR